MERIDDEIVRRIATMESCEDTMEHCVHPAPCSVVRSLAQNLSHERAENDRLKIALEEFVNHHKNSVRVVPTNAVGLPKDYNLPYQRDIEKMKDQLTERGLIEPLSVNDDLSLDGSDWFDSARLLAASQLDWPTVIVCFEPDP